MLRHHLHNQTLSLVWRLPQPHAGACKGPTGSMVGSSLQGDTGGCRIWSRPRIAAICQVGSKGIKGALPWSGLCASPGRRSRHPGPPRPWVSHAPDTPMSTALLANQQPSHYTQVYPASLRSHLASGSVSLRMTRSASNRASSS